MTINPYSNTTKILAAFLLAAALFLIAIGFALHGMDEIAADFAELKESKDHAQALNDMFSNGLFGGIAARNKVFKPQLQAALKVVPQSSQAFEQALEKARGLTDPADAQALELLQDSARRFAIVKDARIEVMSLAEQGRAEEAIALLADTEHPHWQAIRKNLQALMASQAERVKALEAQVHAQARATRNRTLAVSVAALVAGFAVVAFTLRGLARGLHRTIAMLDDIAQGEGDLTRRLDDHGRDEIGMLARAFNRFADKIQHLVEQVVGASTQLAAAAEEMSVVTRRSMDGVQRQHRETDMIATAIEEMSASVQEVARNTAAAATQAQTADRDARQGQQTVREAMAGVSALVTEIGAVAEVIEELQAESLEIGGVLEVIRGVAEQTNLLALNAAIEAARAGEQGRGFAVVADEVRTLANRVHESTEEIRAMIERLQAKAHRSVEMMSAGRERVGGAVEEARATEVALDGIAERVATISGMNTEIASAAEEQSAVAEEISRNIANIREISEEASRNAGQLAEAGEGLSRLAADLKRLVAAFKV